MTPVARTRGKGRPRIDPIAQFMQEHDEALVRLAQLRKSAGSLHDHGYAPDVFDRLTQAIRFVEDEVVHHNRREEAALFPVLERYVEGPTGLMRQEHRMLKKEFTLLHRAYRKLVRNHDDAAAAAELDAVARGVVHLMVNHIHKENHILFPLVQKFLTKDALREIARRMTAPGDEE